MIFIRKAVRVGEMCVFKAKRLGFLIHPVCKRFNTACNFDRDGFRSVVCALQQNSIHEVPHRDLFIRFQIEGGTLYADRLIGYSDLPVEVSVFNCEDCRHDFGCTGHTASLIGVIFGNGIPIVRADQNCALR